MASSLLGSSFANNLQTVEKKEETYLRSLVDENPLDLQAWINLVKHIESYVRPTQKEASLNQSIYREVLKEFPLCYGYWRKLADIYAVQGEEASVHATYEAAFEVLPVSVELWTAYCSWTAATRSEAQARE